MIGLLIAAWLDIRSKPFRTFAAIAGMVAAVVAVVLVDAAGVLSRDANDEYLARNYGLPVTMSITAESGATQDQHARLREMLAANSIDAVSPTTFVRMNVVQHENFSQMNATLVSSAYHNIRIIDMSAGAWPIEAAHSDVLHAVITADAAKNLGFDPATAVGQKIMYSTGIGSSATDIQRAHLHPLVIDGIAAKTSNAFDMGDILIVSDLSNPGLERVGSGMQSSLLVRVNPENAGTLQQMVGNVTDDRGQPVFTARRVDQSQQLAPVLEQQGVTSQAITLVALTIGGLGIFGVGIASVRERAQDFALRRALGASKVRIFTSVIVQTLMEVLLAAAIAIFLAAILLEVFARDLVLETLPLPSSTALPIESALLGLAGALIVGLLAGLIPAFSAARASVAQALRG